MNGLGMLVHQGALAFEIWTGQRPPRGVMEEALREGLLRHETVQREIDNSVLIQ
jgi:shikimate 5-dehydrogenase